MELVRRNDGLDRGQAMVPPAVGGAELPMSLYEPSWHGSVGQPYRVFVENEAAAFRASSLQYSTSVDGNSFSDADNRVNGGFFGPAHEEMAGVIDDRTPTSTCWRVLSANADALKHRF